MKAAVCRDLDRLMEPIRKEFEQADNKKLVAEAYPVEKKKKGPPAGKAAGAATSSAAGKVDNSDIMSPNRLDIRVGKITKVDKVSGVLLVIGHVNIGIIFSFTGNSQ